MTVTITVPADHEDRETEIRSSKSQNKYIKFLGEQWLVFGFSLACLFAWRWPSKCIFSL